MNITHPFWQIIRFNYTDAEYNVLYELALPMGVAQVDSDPEEGYSRKV